MKRASASDQPLRDYYSRRASEYDAIYERPERQGDLVRLEGALVDLVRGRDVLEVACGTGYWTHRLSREAASIVATDASPAVVLHARRRIYRCAVAFAIADAWVPQPFRRPFEAVVAGFWWSHVPRRRLTAFLTVLHRSLSVGTRVVFFDNRFVAESSTPLVMTDRHGDTYQERLLEDGSTHLVRKNFPSIAEVTSAVEREGAADVQTLELAHYWLVAYCLRGAV